MTAEGETVDGPNLFKVEVLIATEKLYYMGSRR